MKRERNVLPLVVACTLGAAALATVLAEQGWLLWLPVALALFTAAVARSRWSR